MKTIYYLFLAIIIFPSCQNSTTHKGEPQDEHHHEEVSFKYTKYASGYELFVESEPFVAGQTSEVLAHFTKLTDFKPLENAAITATLSIGNKKSSQKLEKSTRSGIYIFNLEADVAGTGKLVFDGQDEDSIFTITVPNIEVFEDEHDAIHEAEEMEHKTENPNAIIFTKEQSWKIDFSTDLPSIEPFGQVIKTTAHVQSAQGDEFVISAKTNGIVTFNGNNLTEGIEVPSYKKLFLLSGKNLANNNTLVKFNEAQNNFKKAEANYNRVADLAKDKIVSQKELENAKNEFQNTKAVYQNLKNNFSEEGQNITSPKTGFIKHLYVSNGQYVEAGEPLIKITQNKNLFLKAEVQQKYVNALSFLKTATIQSISDNSIFSLEELNGKVVSVGKNISDENYLIPVTLQIENRDGIVPGSFIGIYLKTQSNKNALTVPNSALLEEQGNYSVFVQIDPESFEKREVKIGETDGLKSEILSGLKASERIVTRGGILVKLAAVSNSLDPHAGHVH